MKIAIVGSGISGLVCAHTLHQHHEITLFEANDYVGGHTHTVGTALGHQVDTGFIVFNKERYPNFFGLLRYLQVESQPTTMSFSLRCDRTRLEYSTASINHLFAQRHNLWKLSFYSLLNEIIRFNREVPVLASQLSHEMTVDEFLTRYRFSDDFKHHFLIPMGAALWSCPGHEVLSFPVRFILEFYGHHGMHQVFTMPVWHVIRGGSSQYVKQLIRPFHHQIRLKTPVFKVRRKNEQIEVQTRDGTSIFDEIIFACHSDQALKMLGQDALPVERELLEAFPYQANAVTLHTDTTVLPKARRAWACWNYRSYVDEQQQSTVTYNMNKLQSIHAPVTYCVSLNQDHLIQPAEMLQRLHYDHPRFTIRRQSVQLRHRDVIRQNRTSFCGAYWGNGFHESGVVSALRVCQAYQIVPKWSQTITHQHDESEVRISA